MSHILIYDILNVRRVKNNKWQQICLKSNIEHNKINWIGQYNIEKYQYITYNKETEKIEEGKWPKSFVLSIEKGDLENIYKITAGNKLKYIGYTNILSPDILIFIDVDDLGFSFIKAIDISSEGVVNKVTAMHLELRGICNEKEDIN